MLVSLTQTCKHQLYSTYTTGFLSGSHHICFFPAYKKYKLSIPVFFPKIEFIREESMKVKVSNILQIQSDPMLRL